MFWELCLPREGAAGWPGSTVCSWYHLRLPWVLSASELLSVPGDGQVVGLQPVGAAGTLTAAQGSYKHTRYWEVALYWRWSGR